MFHNESPHKLQALESRVNMLERDSPTKHSRSDKAHMLIDEIEKL